MFLTASYVMKCFNMQYFIYYIHNVCLKIKASKVAWIGKWTSWLPAVKIQPCCNIRQG